MIGTVHLVIIAIALCPVLSDDVDEESNDVSSPPSKINLDSNLRRALLKALTELENEESNKASLDDNSKEQIVEKASAASVSIYSNGETVTIAPVSTSTLSSTTTPERVTVIFQKSQSHQQPSITTVERESDDNESILTSATNNFGNQPFGKDVQSGKLDKNTNQNSIFNDDKTFTKSQKTIVTTSAPIVSTEESQAKVENVQFFSAPLVAAFTVHQDEAGLPKKVEPIFKSHIPSKSQEDIIIEREQQIKFAKQQEEVKLALQHQEKLRIEELRRHQEKLDLQQKHIALEEEIYRLNLSLRQQQQIFLKQQEEIRSRNNAQPFIPINTPTFTTERPNLNQVQQLPFNNRQQNFKPQNGQLQSSVPFNPLVEAGKLPLNAQFLPVKGPVDFRTPFGVNNNNFNRQTNPNNFNQNQNFENNFNQQSNFQNNFNQQTTPQSNSLNQQNQSNRVSNFQNNFNQQTTSQQNNFNPLTNSQQNNFNPLTNSQQNNFNQQTNSQSNNLNQQNQSNRIFRQNAGLGNFGVNNDFNRHINNFNRNNDFNRNLNSFEIQPAIALGNFENKPQNNRFFRSNLESSLIAPQAPFLQPPQPQQLQNTRFFRSNLEGTFSSPNNGFNAPVNNNNQLSNLLFNSGAFRGKAPEDLSIISKVLALNHQGGNGISLRPELRQQFGRNF